MLCGTGNEVTGTGSRTALFLIMTVTIKLAIAIKQKRCMHTTHTTAAVCY